MAAFKVGRHWHRFRVDEDVEKTYMNLNTRVAFLNDLCATHRWQHRHNKEEYEQRRNSLRRIVWWYDNLDRLPTGKQKGGANGPQT